MVTKSSTMTCTGKVSITVTLAWTLLNSGIALIGYWFTAALIDNINWGRFRIQVITSISVTPLNRNTPPSPPVPTPPPFVHHLDTFKMHAHQPASVISLCTPASATECLVCIGLQLLGFSMVSILFFISAAKYSVLIEKKNIGVFQFIYFFSSFWGQFGPNCTTFLLAGAPSKPCNIMSIQGLRTVEPSNILLRTHDS